MDVRHPGGGSLLPYADILKPERIQECRRDDHQVPNPFQPHTPSRHHRGAGGDYYWSCSIGRSVVVVYYVRDRSFCCCCNRLNQNKCSLKRVFLHSRRAFHVFLISTSPIMRAQKVCTTQHLRLFRSHLEYLRPLNPCTFQPAFEAGNPYLSWAGFPRSMWNAQEVGSLMARASITAWGPSLPTLP